MKQSAICVNMKAESTVVVDEIQIIRSKQKIIGCLCTSAWIVYNVPAYVQMTAGKISLSRKRARARHRARSFGVCIGFVGSSKEIKE